MSSRTRGRASKLPVADKPQFAQKKKKRQGSKVRKSKSSPAEPSHGTKAEVQKIATSPPHQGAKAEEPNIRACPHQGSENIFSFIFCKPDCPRSAAADSYFCDRSLALCNFEDDSSSSSGTKAEVQKIATSPPHQGAKAEEPNIRACPHQGSENIFSFIFCKPDCPRSAAADSYFCDRSLALCNFEDDSSSSSGSDVEFDPAVPYVPFPGYDPTKRYLD